MDISNPKKLNYFYFNENIFFNMKKRDLMLGDFVFVKKSKLNKRVDIDFLVNFKSNEVLPILINHKWFKSFGFAFDKKYKEYSICYGIELTIKEVEFHGKVLYSVCNIKFDGMLCIKYVHQLQQFVRAIFGINLKCKYAVKHTK